MKALFIGLGGVGQRHLRLLLEQVPACHIMAVRSRGRQFEIGDDLNVDESVDISQKYGILEFSRLEDAISENPDFAIVANPTSLHISTATTLIDAGIPVLMEKPVSDSNKGVTKLADEAQRRNLPLMVAYMMRFHPCARKLKEWLSHGVLGRLFSVNLVVNSYMPGWHKYENFKDLYASRRDLGGGVILTEIHEIDLLCWFFGQPTRLWTIGGTYSRLGLEVEDSVSSIWEQETINGSFAINISMSFVQKHPLRRMMILGEKGMIEWDISAGQLTIVKPCDNFQDEFIAADFQRNDMFRSQLKHFLYCIETGTVPLTAIQHVMGGHVTALAMKESLARGGVIEVKSIFL